MQVRYAVPIENPGLTWPDFVEVITAELGFLPGFEITGRGQVQWLVAGSPPLREVQRRIEHIESTVNAEAVNPHRAQAGPESLRATAETIG